MNCVWIKFHRNCSSGDIYENLRYFMITGGDLKSLQPFKWKRSICTEASTSHHLILKYKGKSSLGSCKMVSKYRQRGGWDYFSTPMVYNWHQSIWICNRSTVEILVDISTETAVSLNPSVRGNIETAEEISNWNLWMIKELYIEIGLSSTFMFNKRKKLQNFPWGLLLIFLSSYVLSLEQV